MKIKRVANICGGQDGAIWGDQLFRFDRKGKCTVYNLRGIDLDEANELEPIGRFVLDKADEVVPHSNAVFFGNEFYKQGDQYPLLYSNIYNNYAKAENKRLGVCLVYRVQRIENEFKTKLVQYIEIGFCENSSLWKAHADSHGVRPYGNFVFDEKRRSLWAFVMRNETLGTRYFRFDMPSVNEGEIDSALGVKRVVLREEDILEVFDCEYHRFIQGATLQNGRIYSTEGFSNDNINRPAIRIIDISDHTEKYFDITELGFWNEPEFISFYGDKCLYSDALGNLFEIQI